MSSDLDFLFSNLISDTNDGSIRWSIVGEWLCPPSFDLRYNNPFLKKWTTKKPCEFNSWQNVLIAKVMSDFVFMIKQPDTPSIYSIYLQITADSDAIRLGAVPEDIEYLYNIASEQITTQESALTQFY